MKLKINYKNCINSGLLIFFLGAEIIEKEHLEHILDELKTTPVIESVYLAGVTTTANINKGNFYWLR